MGERKERARLLVHDALSQWGFERIPATGSERYRGVLRDGQPVIPVEIEIQDLDFVDLPIINVADGWLRAGRKLPHVLGPGGVVCYYAKGAVVLDRYDPGGTALQCLAQAETVLRDALKGQSDRDFAGEFDAYWTQKWILVDLPEDHVGPCDVHYVRIGRDEKPTPVLCTKESWLLDRDPGARQPWNIESAFVMRLDIPLTLDPTGPWPPSTLAAILQWLHWLAPSLSSKVDEAIRTGKGTVIVLVFRATNGIFAVRVEVPPKFQRKEFLETRRGSLPKMLRADGGSVTVERIRADAADTDYIHGRNLGKRPSLAGKRIALLGCGTIGGFLAQQLAMCGAGTAGGKLVLVDTDILKAGNIGRHLLGVPYLHRNKAEACVEFIKSMLPKPKVEAQDTDVLRVDLHRFDLVVDATGEEALSLALNQRLIDQQGAGPPHLFSWLLGNGAATQAIFVDGDREKACLKCLKPALAGPSRFPALRPETDLELGRVAACGDADFLTFPVSRSMAAASLACDMVLDWANEAVGHRFRSRTLDRAAGRDVKDSSPERTRGCPACGT